MNKRVLNSLTELERNLVAETEKAAMAPLDEDALLELHTRVRRARNKNLKVYRRQASARVAESGGRGKAFPKNQRSRDKAEIFELALARVSRRVEVLAERSAAELKAERLAAARRARARAPAAKRGPRTRRPYDGPQRPRRPGARSGTPPPGPRVRAGRPSATASELAAPRRRPAALSHTGR